LAAAPFGGLRGGAVYLERPVGVDLHEAIFERLSDLALSADDTISLLNEMERMEQPMWHKSSYSSDQGGQRVEVAGLDGGARTVRDSKDPTGPALMFTTAEWVAFTIGVRVGEFD